MSTPTHFAATIRPRGRLPEVTLHGPICDRLLVVLAKAGSDKMGWRGGHRNRTCSTELALVAGSLHTGLRHEHVGCYTAEPLTEAEHAARFPTEAETPLVGGYPAALVPPRPATATGA